MTAMQATNEAEAKIEAIALSKKNRGLYVEVFTCFGMFAGIRKSLSVQSVGDSHFDWYAFNGKIRPFTSKQKDNYSNYCLDGKD